jgi:hypothetical protein
MAFGSDDLTPYTAQYTWNSNQMAHAMMGFCLAVCWLFVVLAIHPGRGHPKPPPGGVVSWVRRRLVGLPTDFYVVLLFAAIPAKEVADLLLDAAGHAGSPVKANTASLVFDSVTDISFWWTGMFLAAAIMAWFTREEKRLRRVVPVVGLAACLAFWLGYAGTVWQNQKQAFDASGMPFNYTRLAVLSGRDEIAFGPTSEVGWEQLEADFRQQVVAAEPGKRPPQRHYVIYGGTPELRSKLAVSMGCEYAFKLRADAKYANDLAGTRVRYLTAVGVLEHPAVLERAQVDLLECVIIDDLDVATKLPSRVAPTKSLRYYRNVARNSTDQKADIPVDVLQEAAGERLPPRQPSKQSPSKVEVSLGELEKVMPAGPPPPPPPAADPKKKPPAPAEVLEEAKDELESRVEVLRSFGRKTRPIKPQHDEDGISTIWVLAGHPGAANSGTYRAWVERRDAWLREIQLLLNVGPDAIRLIEIRDPRPPNGVTPP